MSGKFLHENVMRTLVHAIYLEPSSTLSYVRGRRESYSVLVSFLCVLRRELWEYGGEVFKGRTNALLHSFCLHIFFFLS